MPGIVYIKKLYWKSKGYVTLSLPLIVEKFTHRIKFHRIEIHRINFHHIKIYLILTGIITIYHPLYNNLHLWTRYSISYLISTYLVQFNQLLASFWYYIHSVRIYSYHPSVRLNSYNSPIILTTIFLYYI